MVTHGPGAPVTIRRVSGDTTRLSLMRGLSKPWGRAAAVLVALAVVGAAAQERGAWPATRSARRTGSGSGGLPRRLSRRRSPSPRSSTCRNRCSAPSSRPRGTGSGRSRSTDGSWREGRGADLAGSSCRGRSRWGITCSWPSSGTRPGSPRSAFGCGTPPEKGRASSPAEAGWPMTTLRGSGTGGEKEPVTGRWSGGGRRCLPGRPPRSRVR